MLGPYDRASWCGWGLLALELACVLWAGLGWLRMRAWGEDDAYMPR